MSFTDLLIIGVYFTIVLWIAWWASRKGAKDNDQIKSSDYFLAGKSEGWFVIGASLFASNIGSEIILGVSLDHFLTFLLISLVLILWFIFSPLGIA